MGKGNNHSPINASYMRVVFVNMVSRHNFCGFYRIVGLDFSQVDTF